MGDDKTYIVQIKGKAYRFSPLDPEEVERMSIVSTMGAGHLKTIKSMFRVLSKAAGPDQWDEITDRYVEGEIDLQDVAVKLLKKLMDRARKDADTGDVEV